MYWDDVRQQIKVMSDSPQQTVLGRTISNFDQGLRRKQAHNCMAYVTKFDHGPDFKQQLLDTGPKTHAETSPCGFVWGMAYAQTVS